MAGSNKNVPFLSLWLIPEPTALVRIQRLVDEFCNLHSVPSFIPHITLNTCWEHVDTAACVVDALLDKGGLSDVRGCVGQPFLGDGSILHVTFGYDIQILADSQAKLIEANDWLGGTLNISVPEWWHMGFLYKSGGVSSSASELLIQKVSDAALNQREFGFSQLMIVEGAAPIAQESDVAAWSIKYQRTLSQNQ